MDRILRYILKYRKITVFMAIAVAIGGMYSYYLLPKQESPDFKVPYARVTAVYPGASPADMDRLVTSKIEDEISAVEGYKGCRSVTGNSYCVVVVELDFAADTDKAWSELRRSMQHLQPDLPDGCQTVDVDTNITDTAGIIISLTGQGYTYAQLEHYGEEIAAELGRLDGMRRFEISGRMPKQLTIEIDDRAFGYMGLSYSDLVTLIKGQNVEIPPGKLREGGSVININTEGTFSSISDVEDIIIGMSDDNRTVVRLKDVAHIYEETQDSSYKIIHNGREAILLTGYFKDNNNILISGKAVREKIDEIKSTLPPGLDFDEVMYQPDDVKNAMDGFNMNLITGVLMVIAVVFIGMGMRNAVIVSAAIPLSIFATFLVMPVFGIKIHQVSIASLIVALGMLVDNAIVVSDAIQSRLDSGLDRVKACVDGVRDVAVPVLTSTLTTVAAYAPFMFLVSVAGDYVKSIPQIVIISLLASYLTAIFVTPVMAYMFFRPKAGSGLKPSAVRRFFGSILNFGMRRWYAVVAVTAMCLVMAAWMISHIALIFFPNADKDIMYIDYTAEKNIDIEHTEVLVRQILSILDRQPEILYHTAAVGSGMPRFYDTLSVYSQSPDTAQILFRVDLTLSDRFRSNKELAEYIQAMIRSEVTGGKAAVKELAYAFPIAAPIGITIKGDDVNSLMAAGDMLCGKIEDIDGTYNVFDNYSSINYEYFIDTDKDRASYFGLTKYDIENEVSIAVRGREASDIQGEEGDMPIVVKSNISSTEELKNMRIKSSITGNKINLREIASLELNPSVPVIKKTDGDYSVDVSSFVKEGYGRQAVMSEITDMIDNESFPGMKIEYKGEDSFIEDNFKDLGYLALVAVTIVYLVLLFQFKSFVQPIIILVTVPLSVVGSAVGLYFTRQPMSFITLLGIVSLFGVVVNNAIVLLDYINGEIKKGKNVRDAACEASGRRLRPIMLSTVTTVVGLMPLAIGRGELFKPMAVALMSGLMVSTLLTLIVIPVAASRLIRVKDAEIDLSQQQMNRQ